MAIIRQSIDVDRRPEDVYDYVMDTPRIPEWQLSAVSAERLDEGPFGIGSRFRVTRHVGRRVMPMTMEVVEYDPPHTWGMRGVDGPVRARVHGEVEPFDEGQRSHVTIEIDFESHGVGKVLVPLVMRPQVRKELPRNEQLLKDRLEHAGA
ncbi:MULTISPECIES: SRPBCC family protein [Streptomyces]|uniref:SRPBCC family protein n=1 Tax=Streptomyces koelreuteriae TaxID=2838015 RepID=A0ABX8FNW9_9ACTN|nr:MULTISPECIES: SRPBCC family protein [Streptomyces]QWB22799.1 SRPBCC family protein [Streptomyces koelreuteriae]UUA05747.1 SRPBCC family protein [Streptomyces koelreuteriae]UUA13374.1 SRPBCC family protein [Streptomyces sp. CRCS-T-1]